MKLLVAGAAPQAAAALTLLARALWPDAQLVPVGRSAADDTLPNAAAAAGALCVVDLVGLGMARWTAQRQAQLLAFAGTRPLVVLAPSGDEFSWPDPPWPDALGPLLLLRHPVQAAAMRDALAQAARGVAVSTPASAAVDAPGNEPARPPTGTPRVATANAALDAAGQGASQGTSQEASSLATKAPPGHAAPVASAAAPVQPHAAPRPPRAADPATAALPALGPSTVAMPTLAPTTVALPAPLPFAAAPPPSPPLPPPPRRPRPPPPLETWTWLPRNTVPELPFEETHPGSMFELWHGNQSAPDAPHARDTVADDADRDHPEAAAGAVPAPPCRLTEQARQTVWAACPDIGRVPFLELLLELAVRSGPSKLQVAPKTALVLHPAENWIVCNIKTPVRNRLIQHREALRLEVQSLNPNQALADARPLYGRRRDGRRPLDAFLWGLAYATFESAVPPIVDALEFELNCMPDFARLPDPPDVFLKLALTCLSRPRTVQALRSQFGSHDPQLVHLFIICALLSGMATPALRAEPVIKPATVAVASAAASVAPSVQSASGHGLLRTLLRRWR